jgi:PAS domain S-box-containing protein
LISARRALALAANNTALPDGHMSDPWDPAWRSVPQMEFTTPITVLNALLDSDFVGIVRVQDRTITWCNQAFAGMLGYSQRMLMGRPTRCLHASDQSFVEFNASVDLKLSRGEKLLTEVERLRADGVAGWYKVQVVSLRPDSTEHIATFIDITAQYTARQALSDVDRRIRALMQHTDAKREAERRSIAQQLHESLAQELFAAQLELERLKSNAPGLVGVTESHDQLRLALDRCLNATRSLANGLWPFALKHLSLADALREYSRGLSATSRATIRVVEMELFPSLPAQTALLFFRVAQEALLNLAEHPGACTVDIRLRADAEYVMMDVVDDGTGIMDGFIENGDALGLVGLRERVQAQAGTLTIGTERGAGTTLSISLPRTDDVAPDRSQAQR